MRILSIGGSGFVSGTLARVALEAGHELWTVTRGVKPLPVGVKSLIADRSDNETFAEIIRATNQEWDLVVDCIGYTVDDARQDIALFRDLTKQFVFISTDFVFDPSHRIFPQPEQSDHYAVSGYGGNKRLCELEFENSDLGNMHYTVFRPCHIYGPGSELGCLPQHARDRDLIQKLRKREPLDLAGGGYFLQQPIFAEDLANLILSVVGNEKSYNKIFQSAGPEIIESRTYYKIIADILEVDLTVNEVPVQDVLTANPDLAFFLTHRIYDLQSLKQADLRVPSTSMRDGLYKHTIAILEERYS